MADKIIQYLYGTKGRAIYYGGDTEGTNGKERDINGKGQDDREDGKNKVQSFICVSDALFVDNSINKKSLQRYIMKLFRGPIAWRANKQNMVTTLSTEAELLALLQRAKEAIFISRLFKATMLRLNEPLIINCNNTQTF